MGAQAATDVEPIDPAVGSPDGMEAGAPGPVAHGENVLGEEAAQAGEGARQRVVEGADVLEGRHAREGQADLAAWGEGKRVMGKGEERKVRGEEKKTRRGEG